MATEQPREQNRPDAADLAVEAVEAIEGIQQRHRVQKRQASARIADDHQRLEDSIHEGNAILNGERE
jgi:hypothetical protein